ncbi:MAG: metal-dependent hydrolase [Anaerolineae bacterium]
MKGISHFITGVALATFFPEVVQAGAQGSLLPMLGGIGGILPDTLDFKFARYFERYDLEIDPGPEPDARDIAEQVVGAIRRAHETGKPQNVMLHTIRLGADLWRQYTIRFDPEQNEVAVRIGPIVNTGQVPLPGSEPPSPPLPPPQAGGMKGGEARVKVGVPMVHTYDAETRIDIFSGPSFKFERRGDKLHVHFLDWHRRWSHSLTLAAAVGLVAGLLFGKWAGIVAGLGFAGHVLEDQLGFMGSNLFYPFTKGRSTRLQLLRSGDAIPNFLTVWTSVALILFNLDRFSAQPRLDPWWFLGLAVVLPVAVLGGLYQWQRRRGRPEARESLQQRDIVSEMAEVEVA